jgi:plastocyanin
MITPSRLWATALAARPVLALTALAALVFPAVALAAVLTVNQHDLKFSQSAISIHQGDTLNFANNDSVTHNISVRGADGEDTEDLGIQRPGKVVSFQFTSKATYSVVCSIHPGMRLKVVVN